MLRRIYRFAFAHGVRNKQVAVLVALGLGGVAFETLGLGLLLPIGNYLIAGGDLALLTESSRFWALMTDLSQSVGFPIGITAITVVCVASMLVRQGLTYIRLVYQAKVGHGLGRDIRMNLIQAFLRSELSVQEREGMGKFANVIGLEVTRVVPLVSLPIDLLIAASLSLSFLIMLLITTPTVTAGLAVMILLIGFLIRGVFRRTADVARWMVKMNNAVSEHFVERVRSARLIRLSRADQTEVEAARSLTQNQYASVVSSIRLLAVTESGLEPIVIIVGVPLLIFGSTVLNLDLAVIGFILVALARLVPMAKQALRGWQSLLKAHASMEAIEGTFIRLDDASEKDPGGQDVRRPLHTLAFKDVRFSYDGGRNEVVRGVSFEIEAGGFVALVGPSGAGKSTIVDLIPRLRTAISGTVELDGVSLIEYRLRSLRDSIAYVSQTPMLLEGSIADQIAYGRASASREEIEQAARMAHAHEFIVKMADGYDSQLGTQGVGLSGGQKQRIELARAILRKTPILILDEPTSNVDAESEFYISKALQEIRDRRDTIVLLIGHGFASVSIADRILVVQEGRITDQGTHEALMSRDGWYRNAVHQQRGAHDEAKETAIVAGAAG